MGVIPGVGGSFPGGEFPGWGSFPRPVGHSQGCGLQSSGPWGRPGASPPCGQEPALGHEQRHGPHGPGRGGGLAGGLRAGTLPPPHPPRRPPGCGDVRQEEAQVRPAAAPAAAHVQLRPGGGAARVGAGAAGGG